MIKSIVVKGLVASLAVSGSLVVGAGSAMADPAPSIGYGLQHAGHDHGDDKPKKDKHKKGKKGPHSHEWGHKWGHGHGDHKHHDHDHGHHHHGDGAHASGGYDSHREHDR